ncbi:sodium/panthothenate symporter [Synergistales bacterium]|nr:sodium/panthothenate symporter [Synergistales bacterium]
MRTSPVTFFVFILYFGLLIAISIYAWYRRKNAKNFSEEYFVGGRSFGPWLVAFIWATSWTSGGTFIGTPAIYYSMGWTALLWQAGAGVLGMIGMLAIGRRIARFASDYGCVTLPDLFVERFKSRLMGICAALSILIFGIAYMVSQYVAAARILETFAGMSYFWAIVFFAVVVGVYTTVGGIRGVAYNTILQGLLMLGGSVAIAVVMVRAAGGLAAITETLRGLDPQLLVPPGPKNFLPLPTAFSTFFVLGVAVIAQPHVVTRIFTVKDMYSLKRAGALISLITLVWFFSLFASALAARALIPSIDVPDRIFPTIVLQYTGDILSGLLLSAPFAAVMSTVSSLILSTSGAIMKDIYQRNINPNASPATIRTISYVSAVAISLLVMFLALNPPRFLQDIVMFAISGFAASFTVPILLGFFWKGGSPSGGLCSMISGFVTLIYLYLQPNPNPLGFNPLVWGLVVSAVVMVAVSKVTKPNDAAFMEKIFG